MRSLVFNWLREAERFTPRLRVLDYTGTARRIEAIDAGEADLVVTTYGTLRRDAAELSERRFDYVILDEAQAIKTASSASAKAARLLARALRPVILRRTKAQVATELPARVEQTLHVELEGAQRKFYDHLLESYRRSVLDRVDRVGLGKARMHILEALLRLRQAACHPALADPRKRSAASAKLDALIPALDEVIAEQSGTLSLRVARRRWR